MADEASLSTRPTFWAKTLEDGTPGLSVLEHMLNVGRVAQHLAESAPELLERFHLRSAEVGALAALHDLGKISPGFQRKCRAWLCTNGLIDVERRGWSITEPNHAKVTHSAIMAILRARHVPGKMAVCLGAILGAHHGRLQSDLNPRFRVEGDSENLSGISWNDARGEAVSTVLKTFGADLSLLALSEHDPSAWWLAGLTAVADWIGSDEQFFTPHGELEESQRMTKARDAVLHLGLGKQSAVGQGIGFAEMFALPDGAEPNSIQRKARALIRGPGVYVIEAPMGFGKTEAALWAAYALLAEGRARGIYFALPTQATSNRIHLRMRAFVDRIAPTATASRLIHGHSWLVEDSPHIHPGGTVMGGREDARVGNAWFASGKRALLAPFGVGTIDQALMGVVAVKHFFVRHYALAGKVVILDEVHSYDTYTGTLVDKLVTALRGLGCTVIILSATLSEKRRNQLFPLAKETPEDAKEKPYPMITMAPEGQTPQPVPCDAPPGKRVNIQFQTREEAKSRALRKALEGGVVLWVCNTVAEAQAQYQEIAQDSKARFPVGLLHARFPFWRRAALEEEWMERLGKEGKGRCGCILVSTQIVEQSVDLDADLLITELAPTDMLLQRMGRLWRHERPGRTGEPDMVILEDIDLDTLRELKPKAIVNALGPKAYVYAPYVLLRTLEVWRPLEKVIVPDQIRDLIEATYAERSTETEGWRAIQESSAWISLFDDAETKSLAHAFLAQRSANLWQPALEDEEGAQTRLNERPMVSLVLCHSTSGKYVTFLDGETETIQGGIFDLPSAKAIHRNLVKVPRAIFGSLASDKRLEACVEGAHAFGVVDRDLIIVEGLKPGVSLHWSLDAGVLIEKDSSRSQA